jgi:nanoRNase/pAp phosphatase (c-di-AMP/oligoRNAs hydrolase)
MDDKKFSEFLEEGSALLRQREKKIKEIYAKKHTLQVLGEEIPAVNSPLYQSELAARVAEEAGSKYGLAYYFDGDGYVFSIRCGKEKDFDVSAIAVKFGGGGHKAASGFKVRDLKDLNGK